MKKYALHLRLSLPFLLAMLVMSSIVPQPKATAQDKSLYERLGGYNAVAAVVDDFIGRLVSDKRFERFFVGHSKDSQKRIRQHIVDQLCAAAGGPCIYTGRTMRDSHEGLNISEEDWKAAVDHLVASLDKFKVGKREKDDLLGAISKFKPDIVEKR
ncbi:MAG TPA: group 1 truncated hemoglobin [Pyrinomonadaceae bacterium]|nr:group 1 truncated hemoglobin [Pyrinomonadaceae bacterium]